MSFYFFAWLSLIAYAVSNVFEKFTSKYLIKNPWLFSFVLNLFTLILIVPLALIIGVEKVGDWQNIIYAAVFWALGNIFFFLALNTIDVSVLSPAFNFKTVLTLFLGYFFLGERITQNQFFLIAIIILSGFFICYDEKFKLRSFFTKPMFFLMADMIFLSFYNLFINKAVTGNGFWATTLWVQFLTVVILLFTIPLFRQEIHTLKVKQISTLTLIAILTTIGEIAAIKAYVSNIGLSNVIMTIPLSMFFVIILSFFWPNFLEKHSVKIYSIRIIAAVIMFLAAISL